MLSDIRYLRAKRPPATPAPLPLPSDPPQAVVIFEQLVAVGCGDTYRYLAVLNAPHDPEASHRSPPVAAKVSKTVK